MPYLKKRRTESPTSILMYMQCPRKYFYRYVQRLPQMPSIHLIAGDAAHKTIQAFHNTNLTTISMEGFFEKMRNKITEQFDQKWQEKTQELARLDLSPEEKHLHYHKTKEMVIKFYHHHTNKILAYKRYYGLTLFEAWQKLKPRTETQLASENYGVTGRIDAIHDIDGETKIIDYKTSKNNEITTDCVFQLAIYSLLHKENFRKMPDKAGIHFLRHGEIVMPTSQELLNLAKTTCHRIHQQTSHDQIENYPRKISGLCKYKTGQCDYYQQCMGKNR